MLFTELEKIHVRVAKIIYKIDWLTPSEEVLQRVNWHTLKTAYITRMLVLTYTSIHGTAPTGIQERFQKFNCKYDLRRKTCFTLPKPTSNFLIKSVRYSAAKLWNGLPNEIRAKQSLATFKEGLKKLL